ncbi:MAG: polyprenyl diphosphate synthase [Promethearchaeota archaeon]
MEVEKVQRLARELERAVSEGWPLPRHVGFILDGNRRWAREQGLPAFEGHRRGYEVVKSLLDWCLELGIGALTLYAFSTENFKREPSEVEQLMDLLLAGCGELRADERLWDNEVRVRFIGNRELLSPVLREAVEALEGETASHSRFSLSVAIAYGGRDEILRATREVARRSRSGELDPDSLDEATFGEFLDTAGLEDPDLIIRTSGERRVSGFLTWQGVYSELVFQDVLFPAYEKWHFLSALLEYQGRKRRFGA